MPNIRFELLTKDNYDTWALQAEALLIKNDLWDYVSGACKLEDIEDEADKEAWRKADKKARADIILAITPAELKQIRGCVTSHDIWIKLESIYVSKGPARKGTLLKRLLLHKLEEGGDVKHHIDQFFDTVEKLEDMNMAINGDLLAIMLLYSLPTSYENFRCAIETRDDLPSVESLKIKIFEETEARKQAIDNSVIAMPAVSCEGFGGQRSFNSQKCKIKCFKCGMIGHKANECRKKDTKVTKVNPETYFCAVADNHKRNWVLDSGCTTHLCGDIESFISICDSPKTKINLANEACAEVKGQGTVQLSLEVGKKSCLIRLENTLYVPDLRTNLISVSKITNKGHQVSFTKNEACIYNKKGELCFIADRKGDLFYMRESIECASAQVNSSEFLKWHNRLGHLNVKDLTRLIRNDILPHMNCDAKIDCKVCVKGKMAALPFVKTHEISNEPLHIIYSDVVGPFRVQSTEGAKYFVTFIDDCTRWCEVYFLREKSEVFEVFKRYERYVEKHLGRKIKFLHSDNGGEYVNNLFDKYLADNGIRRRLTIPHTPQQNGVAERMNRTSLDMTRCLLLQSNLGKSFWSAAVATACHIRNRCPTRSLNWSTPYENILGKKPKLDYLRTFGSKVMILDKNPIKSKLESKTIDGIFVGYPNDRKGYKVWIPNKHQMIYSRDVKFITEDQRNVSDINNDNYQLISTCKESSEKSTIDIEIINSNQNLVENTIVNVPSQNCLEDLNVELNRSPQILDMEANGNSQVVSKRAPGRPKLIRTGNRGRPRKQYRMVECEPDEEENINNRNDESSDENYEDATDNEFAGVVEIKIQDALKCPESEEWINAIELEVISLIKNDTWDIISKSNCKSIVGCRFILTNKCDAEGNIQRRKARLVAKGFNQECGVNYYNTFAPVARLETLRLILALSARYGYTIWQFDVVTAYLNGILEEEIIMKVPEMFEIILERIITNKGEKSEIGTKASKMLRNLRAGDGNSVCLLKKALYGLKQSGRQWYMRLTTKLQAIGLTCSKNEPCLYFGNIDGESLLLMVYVDNILIASKDKRVITKIKNELSQEFDLKDIGIAKYCLGLEIEQNNGEILLHQKGYINEILKKYNMFDCNSVSTPAEVNLRLNNIGKPYDETKYRELIGMLMYLSVATRPDISNIISRLAQFLNKPLDIHWFAAKRVLRYLSGSKDNVLRFKNNNNALIAYTDADWGGCIIDRKSYTGFVFILSGAPIAWKSQKKRTVALSSTEAEYVSLAEAAKEAIYLRSLLQEIGLKELSNINIILI